MTILAAMDLASRSVMSVDPWSLYRRDPRDERAHADAHPLVLEVEDDDALRGELAEVLRDERYVVATAGDGAEALAMLRNGLRPSIVLLDLWLPNVDGVTALKEMRADKNLRDVPVVVITAAGVVEASVRARAQAVMRKPLQLGGLIDVVEKHRLRVPTDGTAL